MISLNSGNANACAPFGIENARREAMAAARALHVAMEDVVVVASTGVIGQTLSVECILKNMPEAWNRNTEISMAAAEAIMTTSGTQVRTIAVEFEADGKTCHIGGIWERFRNDSSQYGNHAVLYHDGLRHFIGNA